MVTQSNHAPIFLNVLLCASCQETFVSLSVYVRNGRNHSAIVSALRCHSEGSVQEDKVLFFPSGHSQPSCTSRQDMFIPLLDKSLPIFSLVERKEEAAHHSHFFSRNTERITSHYPAVVWFHFAIRAAFVGLISLVYIVFFSQARITTVAMLTDCWHKWTKIDRQTHLHTHTIQQPCQWCKASHDIDVLGGVWVHDYNSFNKHSPCGGGVDVIPSSAGRRGPCFSSCITLPAHAPVKFQ